LCALGRINKFAFVHRHWTQRLGALLFAIWFAVVGFQPVALDACPLNSMTHDAAAGAAAAHAMEGGGHTMSMDMGADHGSVPSGQHAHHCTCPGCCGSAPVLDAPARQDHVARIVAAVVAPLVRVSQAPAAWTDFILPFPTAPPRGPSA
jgi:hypothetical protein